MCCRTRVAVQRGYAEATFEHAASDRLHIRLDGMALDITHLHAREALADLEWCVSRLKSVLDREDT